MKRTKESLKALHEEKILVGYQLLLIKSSADVEWRLLEQGQFQEVTEGRFPFMYFFIQPGEEVIFDFDKLMEGFGYTRVNFHDAASGAEVLVWYGDKNAT